MLIHHLKSQISEKERKRSEEYEQDQQEASDTAKRLEGERDEAARHSGPLGNGIAALQIAIALGSICILTKKKLLFSAAALLGFGGVAMVIKGLFFV